MRFLCITLRECIRVYVCDGCGNGCEEGAWECWWDAVRVDRTREFRSRYEVMIR